jgi:hypothetical protein
VGLLGATEDGQVAVVLQQLAEGRFVDNGDGTVTDTQTGLMWEQTTDPCPVDYTFTGAYTTSFPTTGTFSGSIDAGGTMWSGTATDSFLGGLSCSGTVTGAAFTGTCPSFAGPVGISGTINCAAQTVGVAISGPTTGSGSGTATGTDVHDFRKAYSWSAGFSAPDGTAFTGKLATLNGGATGVGNCASADGVTQSGGFAGHCDWRLPTIAELQTIVDLSAPGCGGGSPCIDETVFGPTAAFIYWSSTTDSVIPGLAWDVFFNSGFVFNDPKVVPLHVRAVRGGS